MPLFGPKSGVSLCQEAYSSAGDLWFSGGSMGAGVQSPGTGCSGETPLRGMLVGAVNNGVVAVISVSCLGPHDSSPSPVGPFSRDDLLGDGEAEGDGGWT